MHSRDVRQREIHAERRIFFEDIHSRVHLCQAFSRMYVSNMASTLCLLRQAKGAKSLYIHISPHAYAVQELGGIGLTSALLCVEETAQIRFMRTALWLTRLRDSVRHASVWSLRLHTWTNLLVATASATSPDDRWPSIVWISRSFPRCSGC